MSLYDLIYLFLGLLKKGLEKVFKRLLSLHAHRTKGHGLTVNSIVRKVFIFYGLSFKPAKTILGYFQNNYWQPKGYDSNIKKNKTVTLSPFKIVGS